MFWKFGEEDWSSRNIFSRIEVESLGCCSMRTFFLYFQNHSNKFSAPWQIAFPVQYVKAITTRPFPTTMSRLKKWLPLNLKEEVFTCRKFWKCYHYFLKVLGNLWPNNYNWPFPTTIFRLKKSLSANFKEEVLTCSGVWKFYQYFLKLFGKFMTKQL